MVFFFNRRHWLYCVAILVHFTVCQIIALLRTYIFERCTTKVSFHRRGHAVTLAEFIDKLIVLGLTATFVNDHYLMMPRCEGLPDGSCPKNANNHSVKLTRDDLMLCPACDSAHFPTSIPPGAVETKYGRRPTLCKLCHWLHHLVEHVHCAPLYHMPPQNVHLFIFIDFNNFSYVKSWENLIAIVDPTQKLKNLWSDRPMHFTITHAKFCSGFDLTEIQSRFLDWIKKNKIGRFYWEIGIAGPMSNCFLRACCINFRFAVSL